MNNTIEVGSQEWFQREAIRSIKRRPDGIWDYSSSSLLYTTGGSDSYEAIQKDDSAGSYKNIVTTTETKLIELIAPKIVKSLPDTFNYIDFGPGTEHKEKYFFDAIKENGKKALYVPVDISKHMLDAANQYAIQQGFQTHPIHQTFEDVVSEIDAINDEYRFVSLGLTFANYEPEKILDILRQVITGNGSVFITAHLRDRIDIESLRKMYEETVQDIIANKIKLLGLDSEVDVHEITVTDAVELYCTVKNTNEIVKDLGMSVGDKILLFRSYRYTLDELKNILENFDVSYYDEGMEFVGCVISI